MHWAFYLLIGVVASLVTAAWLSRRWRHPRTRGEALRLVDVRRRATTIFDLSLVVLVIVLLVFLVESTFWK